MGKRNRHGSPNVIKIVLGDGMQARLEAQAEKNQMTPQEYIMFLIDSNCPIINYSLSINNSVLGAKSIFRK